jgi:hypothetical protein
MSDAYRKIDIFEVWGREKVSALASEVTRNRKKLEVLAEIRTKNKKEIDSAAETIWGTKNPEERARYASELPLAFQSIIMLDCLREFQKAIDEIE